MSNFLVRNTTDKFIVGRAFKRTPYRTVSFLVRVPIILINGSPEVPQVIKVNQVGYFSKVGDAPLTYELANFAIGEPWPDSKPEE